MRNLKNLEEIAPFDSILQASQESMGLKFMPLWIPESSTYKTYVGKQPEGPYQLCISPVDVVERMISPISGSGRNVTVDNWFTSIPLAMKLLKDHNLTLLGTIRKNKKEIPPQLVQTKNKAVNTSIFCFRKEMTIVSY